MRLATAEQVRRVDELAVTRYAVPGVAMMEHAGAAAATLLLREWPDAALRGVVVLCGKGNNGGDGLVVARHLDAAGLRVRVISIGGTKAEGPAAAMADAWTRSGGTIETPGEADVSRVVGTAVRESGVVVDALLGTGTRSAPRGAVAGAIQALARETRGSSPARPRVMALDVPSGLDISTGEIPGACAPADLTVTYGFAKLGLYTHPGARHAGRVEVVPLGWPKAAQDAVTLVDELLDGATQRAALPGLDVEAHKGSRGRVLVVAGRDARPGAAALCCRAAFRAGAGVVTLATTRAAADVVIAGEPEVMPEVLAAQGGAISAKSAAAVVALAKGAGAVVFGPGAGLGPGPGAVLNALLETEGAPLVVDADGITLLALAARTKAKTGAKGQGASLLARRALVLTPHPGEMARLLGLETSDVQATRVRRAREAAAAFGATVVLKGARTLIASPEGPIAVNPSGNPGLATAGAGDVLAGVIAAWIARGLAPFEAAKAAVWAHGAAADLAAAEIGDAGFLARDVADRIPAVVSLLAPPRRKPAGPRAAPARKKRRRS